MCSISNEQWGSISTAFPNFGLDSRGMVWRVTTLSEITRVMALPLSEIIFPPLVRESSIAVKLDGFSPNKMWKAV
jgi:hypothetical protein